MALGLPYPGGQSILPNLGRPSLGRPNPVSLVDPRSTLFDLLHSRGINPQVTGQIPAPSFNPQVTGQISPPNLTQNAVPQYIQQAQVVQPQFPQQQIGQIQAPDMFNQPMTGEDLRPLMAEARMPEGVNFVDRAATSNIDPLVQARYTPQVSSGGMANPLSTGEFGAQVSGGTNGAASSVDDLLKGMVKPQGIASAAESAAPSYNFGAHTKDAVSESTFGDALAGALGAGSHPNNYLLNPELRVPFSGTTFAAPEKLAVGSAGKLASGAANIGGALAAQAAVNSAFNDRDYRSSPFGRILAGVGTGAEGGAMVGPVGALLGAAGAGVGQGVMELAHLIPGADESLGTSNIRDVARELPVVGGFFGGSAEDEAKANAAAQPPPAPISDSDRLQKVYGAAGLGSEHMTQVDRLYNALLASDDSDQGKKAAYSSAVQAALGFMDSEQQKQDMVDKQLSYQALLGQVMPQMLNQNAALTSQYTNTLNNISSQIPNAGVQQALGNYSQLAQQGNQNIVNANMAQAYAYPMIQQQLQDQSTARAYNQRLQGATTSQQLKGASLDQGNLVDANGDILQQQQVAAKNVAIPSK